MGHQRRTEDAGGMVASVACLWTSLDADAQDLLERSRGVPRLPVIVRARMLARARTTRFLPLPLEPRASTSWRALGLRFALATLLLSVSVGVGAVVGATTGLHERRDTAADDRSRADLGLIPPAGAVAHLPPEPGRSVSIQPTSFAHTKRHPPSGPKRNSRADELDLLQRADAAYVSRDVSCALKLLSEHARRFPHAWFEEEREALRVRLLSDAGRDSEARSAASKFAVRFPHSILLSRVQWPPVAAD